MISIDDGAIVEQILRNRIIAELYERLSSTDLPQWVITGGCVFQTLWNLKTGRDHNYGIKDYDIFYFDPDDLSEGAENRCIDEIDQLTSDLAIRIDMRNQARVHLWYEERFGMRYPQLASSFEGIDRFLSCSACLGIYPDANGSTKLYAPYGAEDILNFVVRPNPLTPLAERYREKTERWRALWPEIEIIHAD